MLLLKNNRKEQKYNVEDDEIIQKFCLSTYRHDARRKLEVRMLLFIASSEGYESTAASKKEFVRLIKRFNLINHIMDPRIVEERKAEVHKQITNYNGRGNIRLD